MGAHIIEGEFQSDKYPTTPRGKVPLSVKDTTAQDLLWEYAQRRRAVDAEFSDDLESALTNAGYVPGAPRVATIIDALVKAAKMARAVIADRVARGSHPECLCPGHRATTAIDAALALAKGGA